MDSQTEPVAGPGLLLSLDHNAPQSLHEQIERGLREHVRGGQLIPGSRVPSSRALAAELGVSRGVVLEAYAQLIAEGYLVSSQGAPTRVATGLGSERPPLPAGTMSARPRYDFDPTGPDLSAFPRERWMRSLRAAAREAPFELLGDRDPRGIPRLRSVLMVYLGRGRAAAPEPEHTLICSGFTQGYALLCRTLRERGVERIALEDPGSPRHALIAEQAGLELVAIPVDELGLDVDALAESGCEVVVLTPAHQFPTGAVLASERRAALLEWAEENDGLIVEDDYDAELRFDRLAVGALQGLAPERVCQIGSMSARLAPGVGLGWILSPSWLTGALTFAKGTADGATPALDQLALADFIARGELDRHLRRMRLAYRARRSALLRALAEHLPRARPAGIPAGLFSAVTLPAGGPLSENALLAAAARAGIAVEGLGSCRRRASRRATGPGGLVVGYASQSERAIADGIALLARTALEAAR